MSVAERWVQVVQEGGNSLGFLFSASDSWSLLQGSNSSPDQTSEPLESALSRQLTNLRVHLPDAKLLPKRPAPQVCQWDIQHNYVATIYVYIYI